MMPKMYKDRKINDINRTAITSRKTLKVKTIISTNDVVAIEDVLEISTTKKNIPKAICSK